MTIKSAGEIDPALRKALQTAARSILARDEGSYCECVEPEVYGSGRNAGTACWKCERPNKGQEKQRVDAYRDAHQFELSEGKGKWGWCWCTYPESDPRHHGVAAPRVYSWEDG